MRAGGVGIGGIVRQLGAICALVVVAAGSSGAQVEAVALPKVSHGETRYALLPDSSDNIRQAIDRTVAPMNFIIRPIARSRLNKVNPLPHQVRVERGADTVSVAFDDGNPVITPLDGHTVTWSNSLTHETDQVRATVAGDTLRQTIAAPDGERENALVFSDGGTRLHLQVTVRSHRLPRPLVYMLVFRQQEG